MRLKDKSGGSVNASAAKQARVAIAYFSDAKKVASS